MIRLQTPVTDCPCQTPISLEDHILMLGSCFTDEIGKQLTAFGFHTCVNPFGTLYNPVSVRNSLRRLMSGKPFTPEECIRMGAGSDLICSFSHHTAAARKTHEEFLIRANENLQEAHRFFGESTVLILTLGTAWCYEHLERGGVVSNCLKRDAREFRRFRLGVEETAGALQAIRELAGDRKVIFTVSPIRHLKDGAHGNQLSKATLLGGIDRIQAAAAPEGTGGPASLARTDYFPAYEIMMDELRDYRFYAEDMTHPSAQAVDYIRERFLDWALPEGEHARLEENIRAWKRSQHRPISSKA